MKKYLLPILSVAALSLFTACDDDIDHGGFGGKNGRNTLSFGVGISTPTTPRLSTRAIPLTAGEDGEEPLFLIESVTPMEELFFDTSDTPTTPSTTRGTPVYNENFDDVLGRKFSAVCYSSDCGKTGSGTDEAYTDDTFYDTGKHEFTCDAEHSGHGGYSTLASTGSCYTHDYGEKEMHWPEDKTLHFFFEAPSRGDLGSDGVTRFVNGNIQFSYTMSEEEEEEAVDQKDLLFGYMELTKDAYDKADHTLIPFRHALCAVKFNSGYGSDNAAQITKVEIKNLYSAGTCTIPPSDDVTWNYPYPTETIPTIDVYSDYSGVTPTTYTEDGTGGTEQASGFPDKFFTTDGKSTTTNSLNDASFTHTFHLIPQTRDSDENEETRVSFVIHYTINGVTKTRTVTPSISWTAGNIYTYTLTINDAAVTVSEQTTGALLTTNSGNVTEYQRVALAANWVTTEGTIVASQPLTGAFTDLPTDVSSGSNPRWALGTDGYYYYSHPVQPGQAAAVPLYTARTTPEAPANLTVANAHLEVNVTVQAVRANNKDGSGNDVYGYTVWSSGLSNFFVSSAQEGN